MNTDNLADLRRQADAINRLAETRWRYIKRGIYGCAMVGLLLLPTIWLMDIITGAKFAYLFAGASVGIFASNFGLACSFAFMGVFSLVFVFAGDTAGVFVSLAVAFSVMYLYELTVDTPRIAANQVLNDLSKIDPR